MYMPFPSGMTVTNRTELLRQIPGKLLPREARVENATEEALDDVHFRFLWASAVERQARVSSRAPAVVSA